MTRRTPGCIRTDRDGQTLVLVAVMMVAVLAMMALAIDLGMAYTARSEAQRVADSAALAGASAFLMPLDLPEAADTARERAREYAELNTIRNRPVVADEPEVVIWVIPETQTVRVRVERTGLPVWFSRVLGRSGLQVSAIAAAHAATAGSPRCVMPIAIPDQWHRPSEDRLSGDMQFDEEIPCRGARCNANEIWTFESGDVYKPYRDLPSNGSSPSVIGSPLSESTSWGADVSRDRGSTLLVSPQYAKQASTPGWYQYWKLPESGSTCSSRGTNCLTQAIRECITLADLGISIGDLVDRDDELADEEERKGAEASDADPTPGSRVKPVYDAFRTRLDADPNMVWDEGTNLPVYTGETTHGGDIWDSPRVVTALLVHPGDISSGASHKMRIAGFVPLFLEDPVKYYDCGRPGVNCNPNHHLPIIGRLMQFEGGTGPGGSELQKILQLIQ
jgi:hypothetical protein